MDLIERQAAIRDVVQTAAKKELDVEAIADVINVLEHTPSAEPRKGKWVKENIVLTSTPPQYQWHCSECGRLVHWFTTEKLTNYCPDCGARMSEGEEDDNSNLVNSNL